MATATVTAAPLATTVAPVPTPPPAPLVPPPAVPQPSAQGEAEKPGYMTTEFWITALSMIGCFGITFFHWSNEQSDQWSQAVTRLAPFMAMLVSFLLSNQYCTKRIDLKKTLAAVASGSPLIGSLANGIGNPSRASVAPVADNSGISGSFTTADGTVVKVRNGRVMQIG